MSLNDGERQVAPTLEGIRRDHVARYQWAAFRISHDDSVIDVGSGIGYGAQMLARVAREVFAIERDAEAVAFGQIHWNETNLTYAVGDVCEASFYSPATIGVAFEVIEHLSDPRPMLRSLHSSGCKTLFASVPNEKVFPFGRGYKFHHRHYTHEQFEALLNECGWNVVEWWGQVGPGSDVERDVEGRTLVVKAVRAEQIERLVPREVAPVTEPKRLKSVAIVALGGTAEWYVDNCKRFGNRRAFADEVWAVNAMGDVIACDLVFHMDDVRIQEIRAAANPKSNIATMLQWLKSSKTPIMTSRAHPDYPALVEFPFEAVANFVGEVYFNNTVACAVVYALYRGFEEIMLFGCDYIYPNAQKGEMGRACVEYWLGWAAARGVKITLPRLTPLLDTHRGQSDDDVYAYGYDTLKIAYSPREDGGMKFTMKPREKLPTAEQIEAAYDHDLAPHLQHGRMAAE